MKKRIFTDSNLKAYYSASYLRLQYKYTFTFLPIILGNKDFSYRKTNRCFVIILLC